MLTSPSSRSSSTVHSPATEVVAGDSPQTTTEPVVYVIPREAETTVAVTASISPLGLEPITLSLQDVQGQLQWRFSGGCLIVECDSQVSDCGELQAMLREQGVAIPVIILGRNAEVEHAVDAIRNGAFHFLTIPCPPDRLTAAIEQALHRERCQREQRERIANTQVRYESLSPQEKDIAERIIQGMLNKQIANQLDISLRTVERRRAKVLEHMNVETSEQLTRLLTELRLADEGC